MIIQKVLSFGQQQAPGCQRKSLENYCLFLEEIFYSQSIQIWFKVERPIKTAVQDSENNVALL